LKKILKVKEIDKNPLKIYMKFVGFPLPPTHKGGQKGGRGQRGANAFAPLFPLWL
jgi:hypothetical protein